MELFTLFNYKCKGLIFILLFCSACEYGTLSEKKVKGKIVFCLGVGGQDDTIKEYGGAGTIITNDGLKDTPFSYLIPTSVIDPKDGVDIDKYINSTKYVNFILFYLFST